MLDDLKAAWQQYDVKLKTTQNLSNKIITSMIKERSVSRLSKVKRSFMYKFLQMVFCLSFGFAILIGNPFDYTQAIEFTPIAIYCFSLLILILATVNFFMKLQEININRDSLDNFLRKLIEICEKQKKLTDWAFKLLIFSSTVLFPLSFLPRQVARAGLAEGIMQNLLTISISATVVLISYKLGAFKERYAQKFRNDLEELNELRVLSGELHEE